MNVRRLLSPFILFILFIIPLNASNIEVTSEFQFHLAVNYATSNNIDTLILTTSGGIYTTTDTMYYMITKPLVIVAQPGLAERPIITHSDADSSVLEMFRVFDDLTVEGVIFDGGHDLSHGMKYAIRAGDDEELGYTAKQGFNIIVKDCIFRNIAQGKDPEAEGHALYFLKGAVGHKVVVEDCLFEDIGDEAIRMTETEKFTTERVLDTLIIRNCTFTNISSECIRFYADTDTSTTDAYILIENLTVDNSATRMMYIKNNQFTTVRNIIVSNSHLPKSSRMDRADYIMEVQQRGSSISNVDTFNIIYGQVPRENKLGTGKGADDVDPLTIFSFDPLYENAAERNWTLTANSPAYFSGVDNVDLGDLKWATNVPNVRPLNVEVDGNGTVTFSPERQGLTFPTGTEVTITAVPDSGYQLIEWTGDITGSDNPATITVDDIKTVGVKFEVATGVEDQMDVPYDYSLKQNYPNPFNPSTVISYTLKERTHATVTIYDVLGNEITELVNDVQGAGVHNVFFNAAGMASGVYYYKINTPDFTATKKMILVK